MTIIQQLKTANRPLISVEFFPPKTDAGWASFTRAADRLLDLDPDFISVTCGAGGTAAGPTFDISTRLNDMGYRNVMPHCTCVSCSRDHVLASVDEYVAAGFRNVMALRGDPPKGEARFEAAPDGFRYAAELVATLRERQPELCLGVAGYPEKHPEAPAPEEDIARLKEKVDAGADFVTTQLFLDNRVYFAFVEQCRAAGIEVPILPGLLPVTSLKQIDRMLDFCEFKVPKKLRDDLEAAKGNPAKSERIGLYWAMEQISELIEGGAPGIHLYLLNNARTAFYPELAACLSRVRGN